MAIRARHGSFTMVWRPCADASSATPRWTSPNTSGPIGVLRLMPKWRHDRACRRGMIFLAVDILVILACACLMLGSTSDVIGLIRANALGAQHADRDSAETDPGESRVAATPETVKKFMRWARGGRAVRRRHQAPAFSMPTTQPPARPIAPKAACRAERRRHRAEGPPAATTNSPRYKRGALVIAIMDPYGHDAALKALADAGVTAFAMELMPRITRAQVMDVLSSPGQPRRLSRRDRCAPPNMAAPCR